MNHRLPNLPLPARWLAVACLSLALPAVQAAPPVDMGDLNGGGYGSARAINALGVSVGQVLDGQTLSFKQAAWKGLKIRELSACCGAGLGVLTAVNLAREAVGYESAGYASSPYYWNAQGEPVQLPALPGGIGWGFAYDINDAGQIVGLSRAADNTRHAVIWQRTDAPVDLGFMGEPDPGMENQSIAHGINQAGKVVGESIVGNAFHAFVWQAGVFTDLGLGTALDINDSDLVFGNAPGMVPVLWRQGQRSYLPALSGQKVAYGHTARALNNAGDVVGWAPALAAPYQDTAVLWRKGRAIDLGRYPGGTLSRAYGINHQGQIVGEGNLEPGGPVHALRWTVKPGKPPVVTLD
jgi:probable HAF family extracellular repeat protein